MFENPDVLLTGKDADAMIPDVETNQFRGKHPEKGGEKTMIYLDYAANHPVDPAVLSRFCAVEMDLSLIHI